MADVDEPDQQADRKAEEQQMADNVEAFYEGKEPPLPIGVRRSVRRPTGE